MTHFSIDSLIRDREFAAALGISTSSFWRRVQDGTIEPPLRIGGASRWRRSDLQAVIDRAAAQREPAAA